jgi:hypothetical protein
MTTAHTVATARARAGIAARLLKSIQPAPKGFGLSRSFDDCFEMGDGDEVLQSLLEAARSDADLRAAMHRHHCSHWLEQLEQPGTEAAEFAFMTGGQTS